MCEPAGTYCENVNPSLRTDKLYSALASGRLRIYRARSLTIRVGLPELGHRFRETFADSAKDLGRAEVVKLEI